jgi:hypothetical protein
MSNALVELERRAFACVNGSVSISECENVFAQAPIEIERGKMMPGGYGVLEAQGSVDVLDFVAPVPQGWSLWDHAALVIIYFKNGRAFTFALSKTPSK